MSIFITGKVLDLDVPNDNGRIYPTHEMEMSIQKFNANPNKLSEVLPYERKITIDLEQVGAVCTRLFIENGSLNATVKLLPSRTGQMLERILSENHHTSVMLSLRGIIEPLVLGDTDTVNGLTIISIDVLPFDFSDTSRICYVWSE